MGDLKITFVPQEGLKSMNSTYKKFKSNDKITALFDSDTYILYINGNLVGDQRNHTLLRSLYDSVGANETHITR
jgi:hypothetical protein